MSLFLSGHSSKFIAFKKIFRLYFFTVSSMFFFLSLALQVELFFLSLFSFPTGCVLTAALWVKLSDVSIWRDVFACGKRDIEREREGERDTTISHQINGELGRRSRELIQTALVWVYKGQYEE